MDNPLSNKKPKIIRACTIPASLSFVKGMIPDLAGEYEVVLLSSPGKAWEQVRGLSSIVRCIEVRMSRRIDLKGDIVSLYKLVKAFRAERPLMVHSMTPKAGLLCMMAAWMTRVPVRVHTFTGLVFPTATGLKQKILILTDRLTCACATHIVPEGEGVRNDLIRYNITKKPLKVLGHGNVRGIDLAHYDPALPQVQAEAAKIRKPGLFTFVFVGRLVRDKGINELVAAFERLNGEIPATRLLLVGRYEPDLDPLADETVDNINSNLAIEAVGSRADVRPWLAAADVFVFPSYREGFPNVVIEAGAMSLPSIVTDINGSREIIIEGRNGTVIPPHDADALYRAMRSMYDDREKTAAMSAEARPLVATRYEQGYVRGCLMDFYKEIFDNKI